jgi:hypothetical protein
VTECPEEEEKTPAKVFEKDNSPHDDTPALHFRNRSLSNEFK